MRGKPQLPPTKFEEDGITPADAGKTATSFCTRAFTSDHPRGCGENRSRRRWCEYRHGSPPRMRGKRQHCVCAEIYSGDHPRGCGENLGYLPYISARFGSPPRMRGKLDIDEATGGRIGITPADAGKTGYSLARRQQFQDHPRGCGENRCSPLPYQHDLGSPPRMRGKLLSARIRRERD